MAENYGLSGYFDLLGSKAGITVRVFWSEIYNTETNRSTISIIDLQVKSSLWYGYSYYLDGSIVIDGADAIRFDQSSRGHYVYFGALNTFASVRTTSGYEAPPWQSAEIVHEADGSKTASITVDVGGYTVSGQYGSGWTVSDTVKIVLTDITATEPMPDPEYSPSYPLLGFFFNEQRVILLRFEDKPISAIVVPVAIDPTEPILGTGQLGYMVLDDGSTLSADDLNLIEERINEMSILMDSLEE